MKKILITLVAIPALTITGCSGNEDIPTNDGRLVPIELNAGVNMITRATISGPITGGKIEDVGIAGWEAAASDDNTFDYSSIPTWHTHIDFDVSENKKTVSWHKQEQKPFYHPDPTIYTHMKAWYPCGEYTNLPNPLTSNTVSFANSNASVDALVSNQIIGNKESSQLSLSFRHVTSQIYFEVKAGDGFNAESSSESGSGSKSETETGGTVKEGMYITGIKFADQVSYPTGFDISKNFGTEDPTTYSLTTTENPLSIINIGNVKITKAPTRAGNPVMIQPTGKLVFNIDVTTEVDGKTVTFNNRTVTLNSAMEAGKAYKVTLTFGKAGLTLDAALIPWVMVEGSAELQ